MCIKLSAEFLLKESYSFVLQMNQGNKNSEVIYYDRNS